MRDVLARIAMDGSQKLPVRHVPVVRTERAAGRMPAGAVVAIAAWVAHLRGAGVAVDDVAAERGQELAAREDGPAVRAGVSALAGEPGAAAQPRGPAGDPGRAGGRMPAGAVAAIAAWVAHLRGAGVPVNDVAAERWQELAAGEDEQAVRAVVSALAADLADDAELLAAVVEQLRSFESRAR